MELGIYLKRLRQDLGWNQKDLAILASTQIPGIIQSDISRLEAGKGGPTTLAAVIAIFKIPMEHVITLFQDTVSERDVDRLVNEWHTLSQEQLQYLRQLPSATKAKVVQRARDASPPGKSS